MNEPERIAENLREALTSLQVKTHALRGIVDRFAQAEPVLEHEADQALHSAHQAAEVMRKLLEDGLVLLEANRRPITQAEAPLEQRVQEMLRRIEELASELPHIRAGRLMEELQQGSIVPTLPIINRRARERARESAVNELSDALTRPEEVIHVFPGPDESNVSWLDWFWSLAAEAEPVIEELSQAWPNVTKFLETVTMQEWVANAQCGIDIVKLEPKPQDSDSVSPSTIISVVCDAPNNVTLPLPASSLAGALPPSSIPSHRRPPSGTLPQSGARRLISSPEAEGLKNFLPTSLTTHLASEMLDPPRREETGPHVVASVLEVAPLELPSSLPAPEMPSTPIESHVVVIMSEEVKPLELSPSPEVTPTSATSDELNSLSIAALSAEHLWPQKADWLQQCWVNPEKNVSSGPWLNPDFVDNIGLAQFDALRSKRWGEAVILGAVGDVSEGSLDSTKLSERDVNDLLCFARGSLPRDPAREDLLENWIQREAGELQLRSTVANRLRFGLAAFNHFVSARIALDRWNDACDLLEYSPSFKVLLSEWHQLTRAANEPYLLLRRQINKDENNITAEMLQTQLAQAQDELRVAIRRHHHAGGSVQRTHCRDAWDAYMQEALPVLKNIAERRSIEEDTFALSRLPNKARRIFDRYEAKLADRKQMDKMVQMLNDAAFTVVERHQRLQMRREGSDQAHRLLDDATLHLWLESDAVDLLDEERLLLELTLPLIRGQKENISTTISSENLKYRPWLLAAWAPGTCDDARGIVPEACEDSRIAAVSLLWSPLPDPVEDLRAWLSENRPLLLAQLTNLNEPLRGCIEREQEELRDKVSSKAAEIRVLQHQLDALADLSARKLDGILRDAESALRDYVGEDLMLVFDWLQHVGSDAVERKRRVIMLQEQQAILEGVPENEVRKLIANQSYADLLSRIGSPHGSSHPSHHRATSFRGGAVRHYNNPRHTLQKAKNIGSRESSLIDAWLLAGANTSQSIAPSKEEELRNFFCEVVFETETKKRKTKVRALAREHRIDSKDFRDWLNHEVENPNFLPQVTRFHQIRILTVPGAVGDRSLPTRIAGEGETGVLTILLAPGLSPERRAECRMKVRNADSARPIAMIDDLDLCRLFNPIGQQPVLIEGLMEIALEQQRWSVFTPYEVQEGQHVKMEMYVGRTDEANRLATSTAYSRIFSGRRLGKTALLRFVEYTKQDYKLPSGNVLHVLYVPIVGFQNEYALVNEILNSVYSHIGLEETLPDKGEPGDRLERGLEQVLRLYPTISLIVFLDEADTFFESQLDGPTGEPAHHERALSWRMRKLESRRDNMGLPRIRFLFCGYRQTNRSEGAWANWGDVLQLKPLESEDAVRLVIGPLARIGIDAEEQADAIAFRCGYQPALIIRFCVQLVEHLERTRPAQNRDEVKVTHHDVATVFNTHEVQNAIREVTWLNFVGNPGGQLIFASLLKELGERPPGSSIEDAPVQLLKQVSQVTDPANLSNLGGTNWTDFAIRHLRELIARSLLSESSRNPLSVRLRFPHHLPTLLQDDPSSRIKSALELVSTASTTRSGGRWFLSDNILAKIRWNRSSEAYELGVRVVVVGGSWVEPLLDTAQGLGFHLGQDSTAINTNIVQADRDTFRQARMAPGWEGIRTFIGGADLLREALQPRQDDFSFEVIPIGRLTMSGVQAWFQKSRGVEFSESDALQRIMALTGGIPLLIKLLDDYIIRKFDRGATLDRGDLEAVLKLVQETMPQVAQELVNGPEGTRLDKRELELLTLLCAVAKQHSSWDDFQACATDQDLWDGELTKLGVGPVDLEDRTHLSLLLALGWLPWRYEGKTLGLESVGVPGRKDPLVHITDLLAR